MKPCIIIYSNISDENGSQIQYPIFTYMKTESRCYPKIFDVYNLYNCINQVMSSLVTNSVSGGIDKIYLNEVYSCLYSSVTKSTHSSLTDELCRTLSTQIPLLHETIKTLSYIFHYKLEPVDDQLLLSAIQLCNKILNISFIPAVNLIETYLLPFFTTVAEKYMKQTLSQISELNETQKYSYEFTKKCIQIIIVWSAVKPFRIYESQQMSTPSLFTDSLQKITENCNEDQKFSLDKRQQICGLLGLNFSQISFQIRRRRLGFMKQLQKYPSYQVCQEYSQFYLQKMVENFRVREKQIYSPAIARFILDQIMNPQALPIPQLPELDPKLLYENLDPILTNKLIYFIYEVLEAKDTDFQLKKQSLAIFTFLIRCGDMEAFCFASYFEIFVTIGERLLEVNGAKSLEQGAKIFPEIRQKKGKQEFYIEYLKFLQIFVYWLDYEGGFEQKENKLKNIYNRMKSKKFIFPQNLIAEKIHANLRKALEVHYERNKRLLVNIQQIQSNLTQLQLGKSDRSISQNMSLNYEIQQFFEEGEGLFFQLTQDKTFQAAKKTFSLLQCFIFDLNHEEAIIEEQAEQSQQQFKIIIQKSQEMKSRFQKVKKYWEQVIKDASKFEKFHKQINDDYIKQSPINVTFNKSLKTWSKNQISYGNVQNSISSNESQKKVKRMIKIGNNSFSTQNNGFVNNSFSFQRKNPTQGKKMNKTRQLDPSVSMSKQNIRSFWVQIPQSIKQAISVKLESVISKMRGSKNELKKQNVENENAGKNDSQSSGYIQKPDLTPKLSSYYESNSSRRKAVNFRQCLNSNRQLIKQSNYAKSYLKQKSQLHSHRSGKNSAFQSHSNSQQAFRPSKQQQSSQMIEDNDILENQIQNLLKSNPIPDNKQGRLINFENQPMFLKEKGSHKEFHKKRTKVFKNTNIELTFVILEHKKQQIAGKIELKPFINIHTLKLKEYPQKDHKKINIKLKQTQFSDFQCEKLYEVSWDAQLIGVDQKKLPLLMMEYRTESFRKQVLIELPLTLHSFIQYSAPSIDHLLINKPQNRVIRSQLFKCKNGDKFAYHLKPICLIYQSNIAKVYALSGQILETKFQIMFKVTQGKLLLLGVVEVGQVSILEDIIAILRSSLIE